MIPQCNPQANYIKYQDEIDKAILEVLHNGKYILGNEVATFESEFASFNESLATVGVANGTDALLLSLMALNLNEGDKVVTVSHTAVATVNAICRLGLVPIFVDVDEQYYTMDPDELSLMLDSSYGTDIKAVIAVHIYGNMGQIDQIAQICESRDIPLIEDCAQAHGAELNGIKAGNFGVLATFSFYPTKNIGAIGDGGAIVSNSEKLAHEIRVLREYGWKERYISHLVGINSRLDEIQAAILRIKLKHTKDDTNQRMSHAKTYFDEIHTDKIIVPKVRDKSKHVFHQFVLRCTSRDALQQDLKNHNISSLVHYPSPVHLQPAYTKYVNETTQLPVTEKLAQEVLSLPMFPELTKDDLFQVTKAINCF